MFTYVALFAFVGFVSATNEKIVGGEVATIEEIPYQVSLQFYTSHICGGAILDEETIITAAHCVIDYPEEYLYVRAGSSNRNEGGVRVNVAKSIIHADYEPFKINNDIALLKLDTPLNYSQQIQPIAIDNKKGELEEFTNVVVSGWGITEAGSSTNEKILRKVNLLSYSNERCQKIYENSVTITEQMMCAGVPEGGKDTCRGDFGGPMVAKGSLLLGVFSYGTGCGHPMYPGIYTNVTDLISWINENI